MSTVTQGTFHVRRLVQGATGANTINIYSPVRISSTCEVEPALELGTLAEIDPEEPVSLTAAVETDFETFELEALVNIPPEVEPELAGVSKIPPAIDLDIEAIIPDIDPQDLQLEATTDPEANIEAVAMAEAMQEAARLGLPFCEECTRAKLRLARAASPPPPAEPDVDAEAMAQAMQEAARLGIPFCEECTRARLRQEAARS